MSINPKEKPLLLTETEVAELLKVQKQTVRRWRWSGDGPPYIKLPPKGSIRYDLDEVTSWLNQGKKQSTSDNGGAA